MEAITGVLQRPIRSTNTLRGVDQHECVAVMTMRQTPSGTSHSRIRPFISLRGLLRSISGQVSRKTLLPELKKGWIMKKLFLLLLLALLLLLPGQSFAANARDYVPLDPGTTFIAFYYDHYFANELYADNDKISDNADFYGNLGIFRPIYYTQIGPFTIDPQAIIPFGEMTLNDDKSTGLGDITLAATIWFLNDKENAFFLGYTPYLTLPTGKYRKENAVNLGGNRWTTKHEICVGKKFFDRLWVEVMGNVEFFFDNDKALGVNNTSVTSSRDPLWGTEAHVSFDFTKAFFGSVDYYFSHGGETDLDGTRQDNTINTHTIGMTFAYMVTDNTQILLDYRTDLAVENGLKNNKIGVRLGFVF